MHFRSIVLMSVVLAFGVFSETSKALVVPNLKLETSELGSDEDFHRRFISPNEENPERGIPYWRAAGQTGVYVAVGTERGFIGAAQTPTATHLLLLDRDDFVTRFNRINIGLLQIAKNREDYLRLRLSASRAEWLEAIKKAGPVLETEFLLELTQSDTWSWFAGRTGFSMFEAPIKNPGQMIGFKNSNYLFDDNLFARIHAMAQAHRIEARVVDFGDTKSLNQIAAAVDKENLKIGVLDVSNAWDRNYYISDESMLRALRAFRLACTPNSLVFGTVPNRNGLDALDERMNRKIFIWDYFSFTISNLEEKGFFGNAASSASFHDEVMSRLKCEGLLLRE